MKKQYYSYDKNMNIDNTDMSKYHDYNFYDIREGCFDVYGLYDYKNTDVFQRLPSNVAEATNPGVAIAHKECAGGRIRFSTTSKKILIRVNYERIGENARTPLVGTGGFDLCIDTASESRFYRSFIPPMDVSDYFDGEIEFLDNEKKYLTIMLPFHAIIKDIHIGVENGASVENGIAYKNDKPIVFYGSSITHGSCASRPSMIYENILSKRLNMDYINLGFGGSACGEIPLAEYMSNLNMCMFVSDYDYNCDTADELQNTHKRLYDIIRSKNPDIPYLIISKPDYIYSSESSEYRRRIIYDTFKYAFDSGDRNVYYIDGSTIFSGRDWDNCFCDAIHPNDVGFLKFADAIEPFIYKTLNFYF